MSSKRTRNTKPKEQEILLTVFTNTPHDEAAYQVLQLFYKGAVENSIGMMRALNNATGNEELILVGMQPNAAGGVDSFPLAKVLVKDDVENYFSPDGRGGWFDPLEGPAPPIDEAEQLVFEEVDEKE